MIYISTMIEKQKLKTWLATLPGGRAALAKQCSVSKSTVDGWLSNRPIPKPAQTRIQELMATTPTAQQVTISLSYNEYALVETATRIGGYATLDTFAHHSVMEAAQNIAQSREPISGWLREEDTPYPSTKSTKNKAG
jgi:hypothetical protein